MKYIAYSTSEENGQNLADDIIKEGGNIDNQYDAIPELVIFSGGTKSEKFWINEFSSTYLKSISRNEVVTTDNDVSIEPLERPQLINSADAGWHFNAINFDKNKSFKKEKKVNVYVLDTGIDDTHPDFTDVSHLKEPHVDGNGHGTHVGGLIASKKYGIDKVSSIINLINVKVLGDDGYGPMTDILDGLAKVLEHHKTTNNVSIVNMSLSSRGKISSMPQYYVLKKLQENGIIIVASAGNKGNSLDDFGKDPDYLKGTDTFPAEIHGVVCVASSTIKNRLSSFSNFGGNCKINAPGSSITSTYIHNEYATMSGTSMSAPIVTGSLALMMAQFNKRPANEEEANVFVKKFIDKFSSNKMIDVKEKMHTPKLLDMSNISDMVNDPDFNNDPTISPSPVKKRFYHSMFEKFISLYVNNKKMLIIGIVVTLLIIGFVVTNTLFS